LCEQIEDLSLHVDGTHEGMEETLKEFMDKVADKLDEMGKKIRKLELKSRATSSKGVVLSITIIKYGSVSIVLKYGRQVRSDAKHLSIVL
jgi:uncharacterized coiled-coil DUF342 family protein